MGERFMKDFNGSKVFSLEYDKETLRDMVLEKQEEIERLHNIINQLEKWIEEQIKISQAHDNELGVNVCNTFKNKLQELKGDSSNE